MIRNKNRVNNNLHNFLCLPQDTVYLYVTPFACPCFHIRLPSIRSSSRSIVTSWTIWSGGMTRTKPKLIVLHHASSQIMFHLLECFSIYTIYSLCFSPQHSLGLTNYIFRMMFDPRNPSTVDLSPLPPGATGAAAPVDGAALQATL